MARVLLIALLGALALAPGCSDSADSRTSILSVVPEEDCFHLTACAPDGGYCLERTYQWRCTSPVAEVVFDSAADTTGTIHVVLCDGAGQVVYENTYMNPGYPFMREDTAYGSPGMWSICVQIIGLKGTVTVAAAAR